VEAALPFGVPVDDRTEVPEDLRHVLDLVEDDRGAQPADEGPRIGAEARDQVGILEEVVGGGREGVAQEGRLPGAAGSGEDRRRKGPSGPPQLRLQGAGNGMHMTNLK
jgi:hypothetical protein